MEQHKKITIVRSVPNETQLRVDLIIPLFRKMQFGSVLDNQSSEEMGIDVVLERKNEIGRSTYTGIVLKSGDISQKAGASNSITRTIDEQVKLAWRHPITHPQVPKHTYCSRVWVITNGKISRSARSTIENISRRTESAAERNLEVIDCNGLVELLDSNWPEYYEDQRPFLSQYHSKLCKEIMGLDLSVIGYNNKKNIKDIFIDPFLKRKTNFENDLLFDLDLDNKPIRFNDFLKSSDRIRFIVGDPGSGKSILLKQIAVRMGQDNNNYVPIILHARELLLTSNLEDLCRKSLSKYSDDSDIDYKEISESNVMVLFDGLDEISSINDRDKFFRNLCKLDENNTISHIVTCSRPERNTSILELMQNYPIYEVLPLEVSQIMSFFRRWTGNDRNAKSLWEVIENKMLLQKLPKTPMTMTLLAVVYETTNDLPSNITNLYEMFTDLLLGKWDQMKNISDISEPRIKSTFLSELAWHLHSNKLESISHVDILGLATSFLSRRVGNAKGPANGFIQNILDRTGLLTIENEDKIVFSHHTFQEYFCARYVYSRQLLSSRLGEWYGDDWWSEVLFYCAGMIESLDDFMPTLLELTKKNDSDELVKISTLGSMLQSAYTTDHECKKEALIMSADMIPKIVDELLSDAVDKKLNFPRFGVVGGLVAIYNSNYYSVYLNDALADAYFTVKNNVERNILSELLLASAISKTADSSLLEEVVTDPSLVDPSLLLLSDFLLSEYEGRISEKKIGPSHKKVRQKIKKFIKSVREDVTKPISKRSILLSVRDNKNLVK